MESLAAMLVFLKKHYLYKTFLLNFMIMNNKEMNKKTWLAPEVVDLDIDDTQSGIYIHPIEILGVQGPS